MTSIEKLKEMLKIKREYSELRKNTDSIDEFTTLLKKENKELDELKRR